MTLLLAGLVGISLGLFGSGGSVLAVPILKYSAGLSTKEAVLTSLVTVGAVSAIGALLAWMQQRVALREAGLFALVATLGTIVGAEIGKQMWSSAQMMVFLVLMVMAAQRMLSKPREPKSVSNLTAVAQALGVGILTGIVGVGGGFLIVPALVALFRLPMKTATGTSLVVIAVNSVVGSVSYLQAVSLNVAFTAYFVGAALLGLALGNHLSSIIEEAKLKRGFGWGLLMVSLVVLFREMTG